MGSASKAILIAVVALTLASCQTPPPPAGAGSYYSGNAYCWGEVSPGGPRGNLCGPGGHGFGSRSK